LFIAFYSAVGYMDHVDGTKSPHNEKPQGPQETPNIMELQMTFLPRKSELGPAALAALIAFPLSFAGVTAILYMLELGSRLAA
jgi:hypothetical protein